NGGEVGTIGSCGFVIAGAVSQRAFQVDSEHVSDHVEAGAEFSALSPVITEAPEGVDTAAECSAGTAVKLFAGLLVEGESNELQRPQQRVRGFTSRRVVEILLDSCPHHGPGGDRGR